MWIDDKEYLKDLQNIVNDKNIEWELLDNRTIFITGATGLIGQNIVNAILYANIIKNINCKIIALVRSLNIAKKVFEEQLNENLILIEGNILNKITINHKIHFVIHAASQTASKSFIEDSINTINTAVEGTKNVLEFSKINNVESFVYLSTMEIYGRPETDEKIDELHSTNLNTMEIRNCYPMSKRMCENLCACYNVNAKIARLTQTFGPGVKYDDNRVFAQFARCAIEGKDIILHTKGDTKRSYLYTADAVKAILLILLNGQNNEAYNVANEDTYCSILEMAELVANKCANRKINVKVNVEDINKFGYAPKLCMNLDTSKLKKLGWKADVSLKDMFESLINSMKGKR